MRVVLDSIPVELDAKAILDRLRLDADNELAAGVMTMVEAARAIVRPKALYQECPVGAATDDTINIGTESFRSATLTHNVRRVDRVFAYVSTCGTELDSLPTGDDPFLAPFCRELIKEQSLAAARIALLHDIETRCNPGPLASMGPGSGPATLWPIEQQIPLFRLLGDVNGSIGVQLTPSCLMIPNKTISGVLFAGDSSFVTCRLCPRPDCPNRRAPFEEDGHPTGL